MKPDALIELVIGRNYMVESATGNNFIGTLVRITGPHSLILIDAAWISETGRLHIFMREGRADGMEVEPVGIKSIHWASWSPWPHSLFPESV